MGNTQRSKVRRAVPEPLLLPALLLLQDIPERPVADGAEYQRDGYLSAEDVMNSLISYSHSQYILNI